MVWLNLTVRFVVELFGVAFVAYWGFNASDDTLTGVVLGVGAVVVFAVIWGAFLAPKADRGLGRAQKTVIGTIALLLAAGALAVAGQPIIALVYAVVVVVNAATLWRRDDDVDRAVRPSS